MHLYSKNSTEEEFRRAARESRIVAQSRRRLRAAILHVAHADRRSPGAGLAISTQSKFSESARASANVGLLDLIKTIIEGILTEKN
uniref:Uncharacterized protein n=1 Tax=Romanomermis culicivorax TaxID=13658 RepID=A0A915I8U9_ROMCU